jgi:hypothetical protein
MDEPILHEVLRRATGTATIDADGPSLRFRHALTRDAVLAAAPATERSRLAVATRRRMPQTTVFGT